MRVVDGTTGRLSGMFFVASSTLSSLIKDSFTEVCASTSMLKKSSAFGMSFPWLTSLSVVLLRRPPTPSGGALPWLASKKFQVSDWNPHWCNFVQNKEEIAFLPVLCTWPIAEEVHHGHIGIGSFD